MAIRRAIKKGYFTLWYFSYWKAVRIPFISHHDDQKLSFFIGFLKTSSWKKKGKLFNGFSSLYLFSKVKILFFASEKISLCKKKKRVMAEKRSILLFVSIRVWNFGATLRPIFQGPRPKVDSISKFRKKNTIRGTPINFSILRRNRFCERSWKVKSVFFLLRWRSQMKYFCIQEHLSVWLRPWLSRFSFGVFTRSNFF